MSELPFAATTPVSVSRVGLKAQGRRSARRHYYRDGRRAGGASRRDGEAITLGAGGRPLLVIEADHVGASPTIRAAPACSTPRSCCRRAPISAAGSSTPSTSRSASTARPTIWSARRSILPTRKATASRSMPTGRAKHGRWNGSQVAMATIRLEHSGARRRRSGGRCRLEGRAGKQRRRPCASAGRRSGRGRRVVASTNSASTRWRRYGGSAVFLSSGGYHHHIGANSWRAPAPDGATRPGPG